MSADIDVYSPDAYTAGIPHEQFAWLRANAPVYWHEHPEGHGYWVLSKHADVLAVSRDHKTFSAEQGFVLVDDLPADAENLITPRSSVRKEREDEHILDTEEIVEESLSLEDKEIELIIKALEKHNGKRKYAAQDLGISERTLYRKIKEYNIE